MTIRTKESSLSKKDFFIITTANYLKSRWWLIALLFLLFIYKKDIFIGLIIFAYLIWVILYFWLYASSKKNKIFFKKRYYEIDNDFIIGYIEDGSFDKIKLSNIIKIVKRSRYYLLYISKNQFIYLPLNIFVSQQDINNLDLIIHPSQSKGAV